MTIIPDKESNLTQRDWLNTGRYLDALMSYVRESIKQGRGMCIGLFGQWGCGKSSVVSTLSQRMNSEDADSHFVIYDAWKYSGDSFRRTFLMELGRKLQGDDFDLDEALTSFYCNKTEDKKVDSVINYVRYDVITMILSAIVGGILIATIVLDWCKFDSTVTITNITQMLTLGMLIYMHVKDDIKTSVQTPHLFAPEQFDRYFQQIVETHANGKPLVVVIDNLDRCLPEVAYRMLVDIKSFLDSNKVTIIIPVDIDALERGIYGAKEGLTPEQRRTVKEFLRKVFGVAITFKPYIAEEVDAYARKLNEEYALRLKPDTIALVSNMYVGNPRRVIQLFNNLIVERSLLPQFEEKLEPLLCHLLIIKEEFPQYYQRICENVENLFMHVDNSEGEKVETQKAFNEMVANDEQLAIYLRLSAGITQHFSDKLADVRRMVSNSSVHKKVDMNLRYQILKADITSILGYCEKGDIASLEAYLNSRMTAAIRNKQLMTNATTLMRIYLAMDKKNYLSEGTHRFLARMLHSEEDVNHIGISKDDMQPAIDMGKKLEEHNSPYLTQKIIGICKYDTTDMTGSNQPWGKSIEVDDFFYGCSVWTKEQVTDLTEHFAELYKSNMTKALQYKYGENASVLFTEKVFRDMAGSIDYAKADAVKVLTGNIVQLLVNQAVAADKFNTFLKALDAGKNTPAFEYNAVDKSTNTETVRPLLNQMTAFYQNWGKGVLQGAKDGVIKIDNRICKTIHVANNRGDSDPVNFVTANLIDEERIREFLEYFKYVSLATDDRIVSAILIDELRKPCKTNALLIETCKEMIEKGYNPKHYMKQFVAMGLETEIIERYDLNPFTRAILDKISSANCGVKESDIVPVMNPRAEAAIEGMKDALAKLVALEFVVKGKDVKDEVVYSFNS